MEIDHTDKNPIGGVCKAGASGGPVKIMYGSGSNAKPVRAPASYVYKLEDVSAADSGRTENTKMYKNAVGQLVGLELSWTNLPTAEVSAILKAFNYEYIDVNYLDARTGGYVTKEFYVGNRSAPMYNCRLGLWQNVSFDIIQRKGDALPT